MSGNTQHHTLDIAYRSDQYCTIYVPQTAAAALRMVHGVEICLVVSGHGMHRMFSEASECRAGDIYVLNAGVAHGFFATDSADCPVVLTIAFDPASCLCHEYANPRSPSYCFGVITDSVSASYSLLDYKALQLIQGYFELIGKELSKKDLEWQTAVASALNILLLTIARYMNLAHTVHPQNSKEWALVSAAIKAVYAGYAQSDMTLESIASNLYISTSSLSKLFQKHVGQTFAGYVRTLRIQKACELLRDTKLTNKEIVPRCGLRDMPSFYRLFKEHMGMTPHQYRTNMTRQKSSPDEGEHTMITQEIAEYIQKGKAKIVRELVAQALEEGLSAQTILNDGLLAGMNVVGEKFKNNEVFVPEVLVAARAMNKGTEVLKPLLIQDGVKATGRVCIGTVQGDLHDIGKNLVKMMMEGKGLEVIDMGTDVAPETFVTTALEQDCQVICCSALLTTTMGAMREVVECAEQKGVRDRVKIMIGGAPVTQEFCTEIGADMYTADAASAASAAAAYCTRS